MNDDFTVLMRLDRDGDDALRKIAATLRSGTASESFMKLLANHIDPDVKNTVSGSRLVLKRKNKHRPKEDIDPDLVMFVRTHRLIFGEKREAVFNAASKKFGVGKTSFDKALKYAERSRDRSPELFEMMRVSAAMFREAGLPEFAELR